METRNSSLTESKKTTTVNKEKKATIKQRIIDADTAYEAWSKKYVNDAFVIESFVAHFSNVHRGTASQEDYLQNKQDDPDGSLEKIALQGWKLMLAGIELYDQFPEIVDEVAKEGERKTKKKPK